MNQIDSLLVLAKTQIGYKENPKNSNNTKYGEEYGYNGAPWCVIFLWWLFKHLNLSDLFCDGARTASCTVVRNFYRERGQWVTDGNYRPGDIAIMTFVPSREIQHCGLIVEKISSNQYKTIEGNTSSTILGSQDNGGCVALKTRKISNIIGVCRPNYIQGDLEDEDMTNEKFAEMMDIYQRSLAEEELPNWAKEELQEAIDLGITDGTRPMQLIPRYQAAIMALRAYKNAAKK